MFSLAFGGGRTKPIRVSTARRSASAGVTASITWSPRRTTVASRSGLATASSAIGLSTALTSLEVALLLLDSLVVSTNLSNLQCDRLLAGFDLPCSA